MEKARSCGAMGCKAPEIMRVWPGSRAFSERPAKPRGEVEWVKWRRRLLCGASGRFVGRKEEEKEEKGAGRMEMEVKVVVAAWFRETQRRRRREED
ncbi:hypothetical protein HAX54_047914 [Datura stramonium]|uniref:Uncharacterized protein n=1 Tax=Datura stramonium TaxID=4076 RepID=A0ABS8WLK2_DATST|nr:hypothetical protein [Datura stramonium]